MAYRAADRTTTSDRLIASAPRRWRRRWVAGVLVTVLPATVAGCSMLSPTPAPDGAVTALATGLSTGDLSNVPLRGDGSGDAPAFLTAAYRGMGNLRPSIEVASVTKGNDETKATAVLHTRWDVGVQGGAPWAYDTKVALALEDNTWRVTWTPSLVAPDFSGQESLVRQTTWPRRGDIVDRAGAKLVTEREVFLVGIDKTKASAAQLTTSATALATLVGVEPTAYAKSVAAAGPSAFVQAIMLRAEDPIITTKSAAITKVPGGVALARLVPLGPNKTFAQPILGTVGQATAEQVAKSGGLLAAGDEAGLTGLEALYDTRLRGTPGVAVQAVARDSGGNFLGRREVYSASPKGVADLRITLDSTVQTAMEKVLAGQGAMPVAMVAMKASTGEILGAAISPGAKGQNLALGGRQAPGSTFKVVSSLAILRKGGTASTPLTCTPTINVGGRIFKNYTDYPAAHLGTIPLYTALAFSCNTAFISQYAAVSQDDLRAAAAALGLGTEPTLGFPNFMGSVPAADNTVEHAASFIGQAKVEMSPLALATMVSSVIAGKRISPVLVPEATQTNPAPPTPLTAAEADQLRIAMGHVVSDGSGHRLQAVGVQYAKTGTAEYGTEVPPRTHAWMIAGRGDLAIACYVQDGASGTTSAGPLIAALLQALGSRY